MGHLREKYTREYFLHETKEGCAVSYGVAGISDFYSGAIREIDRDILERLDFRGKRVLDIGFGRGEAIKYAFEHGATEVTGVDFSENAVSIAGDYFRRHNIMARLYCADATEFLQQRAKTNADPPFDIVLMLDCVEHIPRPELSLLFWSLSQLMAPCGIVAINTPIYAVDNDVLAEGLKAIASDASDTNEATVGMHCNRYSRRSLQIYMSELGFTPISGHLFACGLPIPRLLRGNRWVLREAARLGYPLVLERALMPELFTDCSGRWRAYVQSLLPAWVLRPLRGCLHAVRRLVS